MAVSITQLENALSQTFVDDIYRQWNRAAVTTSMADVKPGNGKNASWDVVFSGATAGNVAEGADVGTTEFANDVEVPAIFPWSHYRTSFQVTEAAIDAAMTSIGISAALQDIFGEKILQNSAKLVSQINSDVWSGTGSATGIDGVTSSTLVGLTQGALDTTSIYAGIPRAQFTEWKSNVLANGGIARPLSKDLLDTGDQNIFTASGGSFDWGLCSAGVFRKYEGLFTPAQKQELGNGAAQSMGMGSPPGMSTGMFYKGKPIFRDKDAPAGTLVLGSNQYLQVKYLPRQLVRNDAVQASLQQGMSGNGRDVQTPVSIPFRIAFLAKTGDSYKFSIKCSIALLVKRPNAFCLVKDISET